MVSMNNESNTQVAISLLRRIAREAEEVATQLGLPEQAGYDALAVIHGQAFLGEEDAFQEEVPLPSSEASSSLQSGSSSLQRGEELLTEDNTMQPDAESCIEAFDRCFERDYKKVYRYIMRHGIDVASCEDIVQECFCSLYAQIIHRKPDKFNIRAYLFALVRNRIELWQRHRIKKERIKEARDDSQKEETMKQTCYIRDLLRDESLNQAELAAALEVDEQIIQIWESEDSSFDWTAFQILLSEEHSGDVWFNHWLWTTVLRDARSRKRWTQADAAKMLHVTRQTYAGWERGRQVPHLNHLQKLRRVFELPDEALALIYPSLQKDE